MSIKDFQIIGHLAEGLFIAKCRIICVSIDGFRSQNKLVGSDKDSPKVNDSKTREIK